MALKVRRPVDAPATYDSLSESARSTLVLIAMTTPPELYFYLDKASEERERAVEELRAAGCVKVTDRRSVELLEHGNDVLSARPQPRR